MGNTLDPAVFGHKVLQLAPDQPSTLLGISTFAASLLAFVMGPIVGSLSDASQRKRGNRLVHFLLGVPILIGALFLIAIASSIPLFVLGILLFRFGDNLLFSPFQALFTDYVPASQKGIAAGIKSLMDILALLIGRFAAGEILSRAPELGDRAVLLAVALPSIGLVIALAISHFSTRKLDAKIKDIPEKASSSKEKLAEMFKIDWKKEQAFTWWFVNRALFWAGFTIVGTFLLFYIIDVIGLVEAEAQGYLARLSLVLGGSILLISLPAGKLADRIGRKPLVIWACVLTAIGSVLILLLRDLTALSIAGAFIGMGAGIFISANFALLTEIVPRAEAGRYLGISNIASAGGGAIARLLGGLIIDPLNAITHTQYAGYLSLYSLGALLFILSIWAAYKLPDHPPQQRILESQ